MLLHPDSFTSCTRLMSATGIWTTRTPDNLYPRQLVTRTINSQDNSYSSTGWFGYELTWVKVVLGMSCTGYELSWVWHYIDAIMTTMASQITSLTVLYSTVYSGADQRKYQSSVSLAFVWGIHRDQWIPHTKGQLRGKCFHLITSSWVVHNPVQHLVPGHRKWPYSTKMISMA